MPESATGLKQEDMEISIKRGQNETVMTVEPMMEMLFKIAE